MRQLSSDKFNIAWFKLAEFVTRGEKERALGLYRLLTHSFNDKALSYQLEGDLLLAFNDELAHERYKQAAQLYLQEQRIMQAAAVYEHLLTMKLCEEYLMLIIPLYCSISLTSRLTLHAYSLAELLLNQDKFDYLTQIILDIEQRFGIMIAATLYHYNALGLITRNGDQQKIIEILQKAVAGYTLYQEGNYLQKLLISLQSVDQYYYQEALKFIEKDISLAS